MVGRLKVRSAQALPASVGFITGGGMCAKKFGLR